MKIESGFSAMSTKGQTPIVFITQGFFWGVFAVLILNFSKKNKNSTQHLDTQLNNMSVIIRASAE